MFGLKDKPQAEVERTPEETAEAESLVKGTLEALEKGLASKKLAREKTVQLIGSLRPLVKSG